jgi:eukaryotic-like serine/threonine-protein kinase
MTYGGYSGGPYGGNPFEQPSSAASAPAPPPGRPAPQGTDSEVNTLATLSVVFAFVFAPAGAILGHLGLGQVAARGQRGRERALVGVTLSYAFIVAAVVALVVWAALRDNSVQHTAAPAATTTAATPTSTPTITTTTTTPAPPPPPVAPTDLSKLLLSNDELQSIMAAPALAARASITQPDASTAETFDPADWEGAMYAGRAQSYQGSGYQGFYGTEHDDRDMRALAQVEQAVAAFDSSAAALAYRDRSVDLWRQCAGKRLTLAGSHAPVTFTLGDPVDNAGIAVVRQVGPIARNAFVRAIAAKSNVVVDLLVVGNNAIEQATTIATRILQRIPQ